MRPLPIALLSLGSLAVSAFAEVKLPAFFSKGAILQRDLPMPVWGTAAAGEDVSVDFAGETQKTKAGADGRWKVALTPLKTAEGLTMTVRGSNTITIPDVAIGEVWVASGQSNMAFRMTGDASYAETAKKSADPLLRFFTVKMAPSETPLTDAPGAWVAAAPETIGGYSAVAYYFARDLRADLKVPVGILHSSVGGTPAEAWTSAAGLKANPGVAAELAAMDASNIKIYGVQIERYRENEAKIQEEWKAKVAQAKAEGKVTPKNPKPTDPATGFRRSSVLYNGMIAPLQPYAIRGAIWYQGEANNGRAAQYRTLFPMLIADWRQAWGEGDFPFLFVQIAPHQNIVPEMREAQWLTSQKVPKTAMAVITDWGMAANIHPTHKEPPGQRLALAARAVAYGEKVEYIGPTFDSMSVANGHALAKFTHAAGLTAKDGELKGFTIAGEDKQFVPAKAVIKGETIELSAEGVATPVAIRYGWANVPDVNLYNGAGLPAVPFRSDRE